MPVEMKKADTKLAGYVDKEVMARKQEYSERDRLVHGLRKLRFMRLKARPPKAIARWASAGIRAPIAYRLVQTATGSIAKQRGQTEITPRKPGDEEVSEQLQLGADYLLQAFERIARKPLFWKSVDQCAGDGLTVWKLSRRSWEGYPLRDGEESDSQYNDRVADFVDSQPPIPLRARLVDGLTFYPSRSEWSDATMESGKRSTREALRALSLAPSGSAGHLKFIPQGQPYPEWEPPPGIGPDVIVDELWTPEEMIIRVGKDTFTCPNDEKMFKGKIPYSWAFGEVSGLDDPSISSLSVIFPLMYLQPWLDTMLGSMASWSIIAGNPTLWSARDASVIQAGVMPTDEVEVREFQPGKMYDFGVGGKAGFLEPPNSGPAIVEFINLLLTLMDRVSLAPIAAGFIGTRTPGLTQAAAMEAATAKLTPIVENLQFCIADFIKLCFYVIENVIRKPIYVSGYTLEAATGNRKLGGIYLRPNEIHGHYEVNYNLHLDTLQDEIAKGTHAAFMNNARLWSKRRSQKFSGVTNPAEENKQILREDLMEIPLVKSYLTMTATQDQPTLLKFAEFLSQSGVSPEEYLSGLTPALVEQMQQQQEQEAMAQEQAKMQQKGGPGQGLGARNMGGPPKRGGGRPSGSPTQRPRGRH